MPLSRGDGGQDTNRCPRHFFMSNLNNIECSPTALRTKRCRAECLCHGCMLPHTIHCDMDTVTSRIEHYRIHYFVTVNVNGVLVSYAEAVFKTQPMPSCVRFSACTIDKQSIANLLCHTSSAALGDQSARLVAVTLCERSVEACHVGYQVGINKPLIPC